MAAERDLHVVFGSGPVGRAVVDALLRRSRQVRLVNRRGSAHVPGGVEVVPADVTNLEQARAACQGAAVVYNCTNAPYTDWPTMFPPLQAGVLAGAISAGAKLVAMDNLYLYGPTHGQPLVETLPYRATGRKGLTRARMAEELLAAHHRGEVEVAIGRASDFYGPGVRDSSMGQVVFGAAAAGKAAQLLGKPDMPHTYTYVPDIGEALARLGEHDEAFGRAWHIPSAETLSTRAFVERVYAAMGHKPRIQAAPGLLVRALGLASPMMREFAEMLYEFEEPFVVDHSAYAERFGNHATALDTAIGTTAAWFREHSQPAKQSEVAA